VARWPKRFRLSRSTLLYYDRIGLGLLRPTGRTESNYRIYSESDVERLARIDAFRQAGVPLEDIRTILDVDQAGLRATLETRLCTINAQIAALRDQQRLIAKLLREESVQYRAGSLDKEKWISILRSSGMTDEDMWRWQVEFERLNSEAHEDFLASLGIPDEEVTEIRKRSRGQ